MNICLVTSSFFLPEGELGGIGTYIYNLSFGLVELGHRVFVLTKTHYEEKREEIEGVIFYGFKPRYIPKLEKYIPELAWSFFVSHKIKQLEKQYGIDILEFSNVRGVGFGYLLNRKRVPSVTRLHTPYFETLLIEKIDQRKNFGDKFSCWLEKQAAKRSDCLTSSTLSHRDLIADEYNIDKERIKILPLGIRKPLIPKDASFIKDGNKLKILYVSRLEKRKGTLTLIRAIPRIMEEFPCVEFIFIGKDCPQAPGSKYFTDYFKENYSQYSGSVSFLGPIKSSDLTRYYSECDLFVVPSLYESFGLVFIEAMSFGKPVVACKIGGATEVVKNGETGILVERDNEEELAKAIILLLEDERMREDMGKKGKERFEEEFTYDKMALRTEALYKEIISKHISNNKEMLH